MGTHGGTLSVSSWPGDPPPGGGGVVFSPHSPRWLRAWGGARRINGNVTGSPATRCVRREERKSVERFAQKVLRDPETIQEPPSMYRLMVRFQKK